MSELLCPSTTYKPFFFSRGDFFFLSCCPLSVRHRYQGWRLIITTLHEIQKWKYYRPFRKKKKIISRNDVQSITYSHFFLIFIYLFSRYCTMLPSSKKIVKTFFSLFSIFFLNKIRSQRGLFFCFWDKKREGEGRGGCFFPSGAGGRLMGGPWRPLGRVKQDGFVH